MNKEEKLYFEMLSKKCREAWTIFKNPMYRFGPASFRDFCLIIRFEGCRAGVTGNQEYIKIGNETTSKMATIIHQNR